MITTRRERVMKTLNFEKTDQVPKDLGGMFSTGISAFAYPFLVKALGFEARPPKVADTYQMLALPDPDVLDALDCDVVMVVADRFTNAFEEPEKWKPYNFGTRLEACVESPEVFSLEGSTNVWTRPPNRYYMPQNSYVFDPQSTGLDLNAEVVLPDLNAYEKALKESLYSDEKIKSITNFCRQVRESTDRAVFVSGICDVAYPPLSGTYMDNTLPLLEPEAFKAMFTLMAEYRVKQFELLLPEIAPYVDIYMLAANDHGIQSGSFLPPSLFHDIYTPFYLTQNEAVHRLAPNLKTFLHSCGGIYDLIDSLIESKFDILNPVQWSAGKHSYKDWKDKCRNRITLWGGGVNSQTTLPLGTIHDIEKEVSEVVAYLKEDSGFVFNSIHNILAEIPPEKVIALYETAKRAGKYI